MKLKFLTVLSAIIAVIILSYFNKDAASIINNLYTPLPTMERPSNDLDISARSSQRTVILTEKRIQHILYGDDTGGGHIHGANVPCKSEFPENWDKDKILKTTKRIAANDNLNWEKGRNGYYVAESMEGRLKVRVVLGPNKERIITAYPTNVQRNPCPANDN